jgi:hypothetical protein
MIAVRSTDNGLGRVLDAAVELGSGNDPASLWELAQKTAREGIAKHTEKLASGGCKNMDSVTYSVGYIRAMREILAAPENRRQDNARDN